ncbi:MAG: ribosomal L7Ae/L30e/S12e/Gadd45 family protein [Oscillospiraceae bacterium]|nr:ribosomal L7Ae/L30e/S12e/Gadd45 family protein [Oscillospiraceae bacterium]MDY3066284.1 ribosomal L7Ae/L30e/S12e/Gadd45 family protein [Oscillospiraceae bacterium]
MDKVLQDIGLCRRAGALCLGTDAVTGALKAQRAAVVVISAQLSEKSQKEMRFLSEKYQAEICLIPHSFEQIGRITRKPVGIMCITDQSLGEKLLKDAAAVGQGELGGLQNDTKI